MNKNDIDCYRYIIDSSVSTIRNNDYIIIHNSMEVVQYIIYIYIPVLPPFHKGSRHPMYNALCQLVMAFEAGPTAHDSSIGH